MHIFSHVGILTCWHTHLKAILQPKPGRELSYKPYSSVVQTLQFKPCQCKPLNQLFNANPISCYAMLCYAMFSRWHTHQIWCAENTVIYTLSMRRFP